MNSQLERFADLVATVTSRLDGKRLDASLETELNQTLSPTSATYGAIFDACREAIDDGWMCAREAAGIKFGRVIKPSSRTHGFSVDVVDMHDIAGPHHVHPNGEIDLVMPVTPGAQFDGYGAGWCVYVANSAHRPTVSGGRALILYLLPEGKIEFTER